MDEGRLALTISTPDGRKTRWGGDEGDFGRIPRGLSFTTSDPGGFKDLQTVLDRPVDVTWPDLTLLADVLVYGPGNATAWEGRLQETPSHAGAEQTWSPGAVGWVAHLDDQPFQEIYIDRDVTQWGEPTVSQKLALLAANVYSDGCDIQALAEANGLQALVFAYSALRKQYRGGQIVYYGGGVDLGAVNFVFRGSGLDTAWLDVAQLTSEAGTVLGETGDFDGQAGPVESGCSASGAGAKRVVISTWRGQGEGEIDPYNGSHRWETPVVRGRHGIVPHGTAVTNWGYYASEVIADIARRFAPRLAFTTGPEGSVVDTNFAIPQLAFREPTKPSDGIMAVNAYHQYSWGVEDDRTLFFRPTSTFRKRWRVRRSRGHEVDLLGPQAEDAVNGVVCVFTDPGGVQRVIGPPGLPNAYATYAALADTRESNPVNLAGIGAKYGLLQLQFITNLNGAAQVAAAWLADRLVNANSRGSISVAGPIEDEYGVDWPPWAMRAGDSATVEDGDGVERRIIGTNYDHDSRRNRCDLDSTPHRWDALAERMGVVLVGIV